MLEFDIPYKFTPRPYQLPLLKALDSGYKRAVVVWSRGAGKDLCAMNYMIKRALQHKGVYLHCFPNYNQAKRAIWKSVHETGIEGESIAYLDHIPPEIVKSKNSSEMTIELINGSIYCVLGVDGKNAQRARGMNPTGVIMSEYAFMDEDAWTTIEPRVKQNNGIAIFVSTPNGQNHFYNLYNHAKANPENYFSSLITIKDVGIIGEEHITDLRSRQVPEDFIQQEYYCFPEGQHVMTSNGMIDIKNIVPGMLVLTHTGRFRKVIETYEREYEGDLIRIKSYGTSEDLLCTPNHPIRVYERHSQSFRWIQAEYIKQKYRLFFPKTRFSGNFFSENFLKMIAWYICEGSSGLNHLQFSVGDIKEAEYVSEICKTCGYETTINICETAVNVIINDTYLLDTLKTLCGNDAESKHIPMHLLGDKAEIFFFELMKGDGCDHLNKGQRRISFSTISKTLAYQVQLLAHSLGLTAGIYVRKAHKGNICGRDVNCKQSYSVQVGSVELRQESTTLIRGKYGIGACVRSVSKENFKGKVYNFKVQYDESYVVNGRAVHNCSFTRGAEGSYYGKLIQRARDEGRICELAIDRDLPVYTSWDIGFHDSTCIWWFQIKPNGTYNFIDYYENHGEGLRHYIDKLNEFKEKNKVIYASHYVPHDMGNGEFSSGDTRLNTAREFGYHMSILERKPVADGIQAVRSILNNSYFDGQKCKFGLQCLDFYRKKWNDALKVYYDTPLHDKWSHGADSMRYAAMGIKTYGHGGGSSDDDFKAIDKYFGR